VSVVEPLRSRRQELGLSVAAVVALIRERRPNVRGIHISSLSSWEQPNCSRMPSPDQLAAWADALGMKLLLVPARAEDAQVAA